MFVDNRFGSVLDLWPRMKRKMDVSDAYVHVPCLSLLCSSVSKSYDGYSE